MHTRGMHELFFSRSQNAGGEKILWTFHRNPSFESQIFQPTYPTGKIWLSALILHFAVCKITISSGSAVPVPGAVQPERTIQRERERERQRERGEKSALLKHGKETVAAVSNTITLCISIFYLMSNTLGLLARVFSGKSSKCNVPERD